MLKGLPDVRFAEQNHYLGVTALVPPPPVDDPLYRFQWALTRIGAERAWQHPALTAPVVIAILDTGISTAYLDLLAHLWDDGVGNHGFNVLTSTSDVEDEDGHGTLLGWHYRRRLQQRDRHRGLAVAHPLDGREVPRRPHAAQCA